MREFFSLLINPVPFLYLLLLAGSMLFIFKWKRSGKVFLIAGLFWFFLITTPFLPKFLIRSLESQYLQLSDASIKNIPVPCDIIVLGGGHSDDKNLSPNNQLTSQALTRLVEGIRIHKMIHGSRLILSGSKGRSQLPQALVLYRTALVLGIDSSAMVMQTEPSNTLMEAEEYVRIFGRENTLIVVTSASHMPRAIMHFRDSGTNPVAAPTHFLLKEGSGRQTLIRMPSYEYVLMMKMAAHEYAGRIWAKAGGR